MFVSVCKWAGSYLKDPGLDNPNTEAKDVIKF